jgi:uncharacterized protein
MSETGDNNQVAVFARKRLRPAPLHHLDRILRPASLAHLLVGVIFGCRMVEDHKDLIREWCTNRQAGVSFYQAQEASRTYSLEIIEV